PANAARPDSKDKFYYAKEKYYEELAGKGVAGAAWFRHARNAARSQLNKPPAPEAAATLQRRREQDMQEGFALFTGGRAVSENLQLDRDLLPRTPEQS